MNWSMAKPEEAAPVAGTTLGTTGPVPAEISAVCMYVCLHI